MSSAERDAPAPSPTGAPTVDAGATADTTRTAGACVPAPLASCCSSALPRWRGSRVQRQTTEPRAPTPTQASTSSKSGQETECSRPTRENEFREISLRSKNARDLAMADGLLGSCGRSSERQGLGCSRGGVKATSTCQGRTAGVGVGKDAPSANAAKGPGSPSGQGRPWPPKRIVPNPQAGFVEQRAGGAGPAVSQ